MAEQSAAAESILKVGVRGRCPRCGQGHLFEGFLTLAPRCEVCGLDYSFADPADGPAFFVMILMGIPVGILAVWIELAFEPPLWVHLVTTVPFMFLASALTLAALRGAPRGRSRLAGAVGGVMMATLLTTRVWGAMPPGDQCSGGFRGIPERRPVSALEKQKARESSHGSPRNFKPNREAGDSVSDCAMMCDSMMGAV